MTRIQRREEDEHVLHDTQVKSQNCNRNTIIKLHLIVIMMRERGYSPSDWHNIYTHVAAQHNNSGETVNRNIQLCIGERRRRGGADPKSEIDSFFSDHKSLSLHALLQIFYSIFYPFLISHSLSHHHRKFFFSFSSVLQSDSDQRSPSASASAWFRTFIHLISMENY